MGVCWYLQDHTDVLLWVCLECVWSIVKRIPLFFTLTRLRSHSNSHSHSNSNNNSHNNNSSSIPLLVVLTEAVTVVVVVLKRTTKINPAPMVVMWKS